MSIIKSIQRGIADRTLTVGKPEINSLRLYVNNTKRNPRAPIDKLVKDLTDFGPWPLTPDFNAKSLAWMLKMLMVPDMSRLRQNEQTRRLSESDKTVVLGLEKFELVGIVDASTDTSTDYETRYKPGHERRSTYSVFRAVSPIGSFHFFHLPYQATNLAYPTGINVVNDLWDLYAS